MSGNPPPKIQKTVRILPSEVSSRKLTQVHVEALVATLIDVTDSSGTLEVVPFDDNTIFDCPLSSIADILKARDIKRIEGSLLGSRSKEHQYKPTVRINLLDTYDNAPFIFEITGHDDEVSRARAKLDDEIKKWPRTLHWAFHSHIWNLMPLFVPTVVIFLLAIWVAVTPIFKDNPRLLSLSLLATAVFPTLPVWMFLNRRNRWTPFIWFYKPDGFVEQRRKYIFWFASVFLTLFLGVVATLIGQQILQPVTSPTPTMQPDSSQ